MNNEDMRDVMESLETLDSLARLFKNLWFARVRDEIRDEKVKAYLMVFEDAFPGVNHVVSFVRQHAATLASGEQRSVREGFAALTQALLARDVEADLRDGDSQGDDEQEQDIEAEMFVEESLEKERELTAGEREALASVNQGDIDALFSSGPAVPASETETIDALFEGTGGGADEDSTASSDDIEAFLASADEATVEVDPEVQEVETHLEPDEGDTDEEAEEEVDVLEDAQEEAELDEFPAELAEEEDFGDVDEDEPSDAEDLDEGVEVAELTDEELEDYAEEDGSEESVDLAELLADDDEEELGEEELDLEELLGTDDEDDVEDAAAEPLDAADIGELLNDGEEEEEAVLGTGPEISEDEMAALLGDAGAEEEAPAPKKASPARKAKPKPKPKPKPDPRPRPKAKAKAKAAPPKTEASPATDDAAAGDDMGNGEETISQEEIDSLFG